MERYDVIIVGGGISGLTVANELSRHSYCRIMVLEKGTTYQERQQAVDSNLLEGLGGAGTIGGGKLCYPPASGAIWRKTGMQSPNYLRSLLQCYMDLSHTQWVCNNETIEGKYDCNFQYRYYEKKYVSELITKTEMAQFIQGLIDKAMNNSVVIRTGCKMIDYLCNRDEKQVVYTDKTGCTRSATTQHLVFACGRSAAEQLVELLPKSYIKQQPADLGIRLVFPRRSQSIFAHVGKDVKLKAHYGNILVRTFCVCSGGTLARIHYHGVDYFDGHFDDKISTEVNLGILARSPDCVGTKAAIDFIRSYQDMVNKKISLVWFLKNWPDLAKTDTHRELFAAIAQFSKHLLDSGKFAADPEEITVAMPSVDRYSPIIKTDRNFCTNDLGVWVVGDAAGISRGFVQSFWSGYCSAASIAGELSANKRSVIL